MDILLSHSRCNNIHSFKVGYQNYIGNYRQDSKFQPKYYYG